MSNPGSSAPAPKGGAWTAFILLLAALLVGSGVWTLNHLIFDVLFAAPEDPTEIRTEQVAKQNKNRAEWMCLNGFLESYGALLKPFQISTVRTGDDSYRTTMFVMVGERSKSVTCDVNELAIVAETWSNLSVW